jgi:hypothetical protein
MHGHGKLRNYGIAEIKDNMQVAWFEGLSFGLQ